MQVGLRVCVKGKGVPRVGGEGEFMGEAWNNVGNVHEYYAHTTPTEHVNTPTNRDDAAVHLREERVGRLGTREQGAMAHSRIQNDNAEVCAFLAAFEGRKRKGYSLQN